MHRIIYRAGPVRIQYVNARYYFLPDSPPELTTTGTFLGLPKDCKFYVPKGRLDVYQTAESWSSYASYMVEMEGDVL